MIRALMRLKYFCVSFSWWYYYKKRKSAHANPISLHMSRKSEYAVTYLGTSMAPKTILRLKNMSGFIVTTHL